MFNSIASQVGMAMLAAGMLFFYVKPAFVEIGEKQNTIAQYQQEQEKINSVNNRLTELVNRINTISALDMKSLLTFMPDTIDFISISRDIFIMAEQSKVKLEDVTYAATPQALAVVEPNAPIQHTFSVSISGTYLQIKDFLYYIEHNNYPLDVHEFKLAPSESDFLNAEFLLITYSHLDSAESISGAASNR